MSRSLRVWLSILFLFVGAMLCFAAFRFTQSSGSGSMAEDDPDSETTFTAAVGNGQFELTDQNGEKFSSEQLKGKVWLGNFFFTGCTMQCRAQSRKLQLFHTDYKDRGLQIVSITCDTANDNPSQLLAYSKDYNADSDSWHFLTDKEFETVEAIANDFFLAPLKKLTHADQVYLFDRDGTLIKTYGIIDAPTFREMQADIEAALANTESDADETNTSSEVTSDSATLQTNSKS